MSHDGEIVGRDEELREISAFLEQSAPPSALIIEGDAGIGKTTLWRYAIRAATGNGWRVLETRPSAAETGLAFSGLTDLLADSLEDVVAELPPPQRAALEIALLRRGTREHPADPRAVSFAVLGAFRALAAEAPVMAAVDDVQWLDRETAAVLAYALRRLDEHPVRLVASLRSDPANPHSVLLEGAHAGLVTHLRVGPLSAGAMHRVIRIHLNRVLPRPVLLRLHELAGGNSFYALELARSLPDDPRAPLSLPPTLEGVTRERLGRLDAQVRRLLEPAALVADPTATMVEDLGGNPDRPAGNLDDAVAAGVIAIEGDRLRFTHPLLAEAMAEMIGPRRRRQLHSALADLVSDPEEQARHLALAAAGPDETVAAALDAAAAHARSRGAAQAAAELSERAVALTPPDALERINRRRLTAAEHCQFAGDIEKARALLEEVAASSEPGRVRAEALTRLAGVRGMAEGFPVTVNLLRRALAEPGLEPRQEVNINCELAWMAHQGGDNREGARYAEAALVRAEQLSDPATLVIALAAVAQISFARTGRVRHDLLDRALELERSLDGGGYAASGWWTWHAGLPMRLSPSRVTLALLLGRSDRHEESRVLWRALTAEARGRTDPDVVRCLFHRAQMEMTAGAWDRAAELCNEAIQLTHEIGLELFEPLCRSILAEIDAYTGETEKDGRAIRELLRVAEAGMFRWAAFRLRTALAVLELSYGDAVEAWRHAAPLLDADELDAALAQLAGSAGIEAVLATSERRQAERLLGQLEERVIGGDAALHPLALRCRGLLLASEGEFELAIASLADAALAPQPPQGANPFELARTLLALGRVQRRAKRRRDARVSLERGLAIFEELGALVWAENARHELARVSGRAPSGAELTPSERRLAELVSQGRSNKEAAAALFVTPKTVETKLSRIYAKLGIHSRVELSRHFTGPSSG